MDIQTTFLNLTKRTYPHGFESELYHLLPSNLETDEFGNRFLKIGQSSTMFTCHLDTATSAHTDVVHVIENDMIKTDGKSILGADDKAGVTIMLYLIENNIPGLYYFFLGEEVGCIGSKKLASQHKTLKDDSIKRVISFDRRGLGSVITFQASKRCCSETFGNALAAELNRAGLAETTNPTVLNYSTDATGIYTDSAEFISLYPECTNISVGYYSEHTFSERQNIKHLDKLAKACTLVNWENLPVERDPSVVEYKSYSGYSGYGYDDYGYGYNSYSGSSYTPAKTNKVDNRSMEEKTWFHDTKYNYIGYMVENKSTNIVTDSDLCQERLEEEKGIIEEFLTSLEIQYSNIEWNGHVLKVLNLENESIECDRGELSEFLEKLNFWMEVEQETIC